MHVENVSKTITRRGERDHDPECNPEHRQGIMDHRMLWTDPTPKGLAKFYVRHEGFRYAAYTFYVRRNGRVYQLNDLNVITHHALAWSSPYIAVAWEGDFRLAVETPSRVKGKPPTKKQFEAGARLHADLCWLHQWAPGTPQRIVGHTAKPNATSWPKKVCPGSLLDMTKLRSETAKYMEDLPVRDSWADREIILRRQGFTF